MTSRFYLIGIIFATALALGSFFLIVGFFLPESASRFLLGLLFFSLFIGLAGLFSLAGYLTRRKTRQKGQGIEALNISFRQGTLLALLLAGSLFLRSAKIFWWESGLVLLLLVLAVEYFSLRRQE